jgi:dipeptidase D
MQSPTEKILNYFEQINAIPRCSKDEGRIAHWLQAWADGQGLDRSADSTGNLVVRVPAGPGQENRPIVVLQGHMDMVCEKTPDSRHDFSKDPIRSKRVGDWLVADRTTLGADNGIALAYALALAEEESIHRPPLELLFTVDEETGLNGVKAMAPDLIDGRILINLDSEDEGIFTIGCAGGLDTSVALKLQTESVASHSAVIRVIVGGLNGGHSGIDIHKHRGNANRILARMLARICQISSCRLVSLRGGSRHNAIARDAEALLVADQADRNLIENAVVAMQDIIRQEYGDHESEFFLKVESGDLPAGSACLTQGDTDRIIWLLLAMPHGVAGMSPMIKGLVETSSNLAVARVQEGRLSLLSSQRSALASRLAEVTATVHAVADLAGATCLDENKYPAWQPDMDAPLLHRARQVYMELFDKEPRIQVIHAGLECAIIGDRYPGMQMISFGPTIRSPHSPAERLNIPSVDLVWRLLVRLLEVVGR